MVESNVTIESNVVLSVAPLANRIVDLINQLTVDGLPDWAYRIYSDSLRIDTEFYTR